RVGHAGGLGRQGLLAGRRPPPGPAVVVRSGAPRGADVGVRLPQDRFSVVGHRRRRSLWRVDARRGLSQGTGRDPRRHGHRGVSAGVRRPTAARGRLRERDAHRHGCGRELVLLQRSIPAALVAGHPRGTATPEREVAPAIVAGDDVYAIPGPWRLRTGDDPRYATREFDEDTWETVPVPKPWEEAGHPDYDGYAWYRTRFPLPPAPAGRPAYLELGKVDDVDETFLNGVKLGATGAFPPNYRSEWQAYRRYRIPVDALNWGGENVLAVRVYD